MKPLLITTVTVLMLGPVAHAQDPGNEPADTAPAEVTPVESPDAAPKPATPTFAETRGAQNNPTAGELTEALHEAVTRGFIYLKAQQNTDGSVGAGGRGRYGRHVGITALCALAFMSDGHLPGRGEYGNQVERAMACLLIWSDPLAYTP